MDPIVKKNRNFFFRYMLNVLKRDLEKQAEEEDSHPQIDPNVSLVCSAILTLKSNSNNKFRHLENPVLAQTVL